MEQKEYDALRKQIKKEQEEIKSSKEAAKKFLIELGIMTPDGKMKKEFIPVE
jgi:hypothetical protein